MWKIDIDHRSGRGHQQGPSSPYYIPGEVLIHPFRIEDKEHCTLFEGHCAQFMHPAPLWDFGLRHGGEYLLYQAADGFWLPYTDKRQEPDL